MSARQIALCIALDVVLWAILIFAGIGVVHVLAGDSKHVRVAPEVCERQGHVVSAVQSGSVITVRCSSGIIELVASH